MLGAIVFVQASRGWQKDECITHFSFVDYANTGYLHCAFEISSEEDSCFLALFQNFEADCCTI